MYIPPKYTIAEEQHVGRGNGRAGSRERDANHEMESAKESEQEGEQNAEPQSRSSVGAGGGRSISGRASERQ